MTRVPHVKCSKCNYFYNVNFRFIQINYVGVIIKHFNKRIVNVKLIHIIQIQNYSNSTTYKTALGRSAQQSVATVGLWRSTSAITAVKIYPASGNFDTGSIFTIYGIAAA